MINLGLHDKQPIKCLRYVIREGRYYILSPRSTLIRQDKLHYSDGAPLEKRMEEVKEHCKLHWYSERTSLKHCEWENRLLERGFVWSAVIQWSITWNELQNSGCGASFSESVWKLETHQLIVTHPADWFPFFIINNSWFGLLLIWMVKWYLYVHSSFIGATYFDTSNLCTITVGKEMYGLNQPNPLSPLSDEKFKRRSESRGNPKIYAIWSRRD